MHKYLQRAFVPWVLHRHESACNMLTQSVAIVQAIARCKRPRSGRERRLLHAHSAETCGPRTVLVNNYSMASLSPVTAGKIKFVGFVHAVHSGTCSSHEAYCQRRTAQGVTRRHYGHQGALYGRPCGQITEVQKSSGFCGRRPRQSVTERHKCAEP